MLMVKLEGYHVRRGRKYWVCANDGMRRIARCNKIRRYADKVLQRAGCGRACVLLPEEFLDFADDFHETVHLGAGVVKVKAGTGGGFHAELVHERLGAMMSTAECDARLVGEGHDVVRMHVLEQETDEAGALRGIELRPEEADVVKRSQFFV